MAQITQQCIRGPCAWSWTPTHHSRCYHEAAQRGQSVLLCPVWLVGQNLTHSANVSFWNVPLNFFWRTRFCAPLGMFPCQHVQTKASSTTNCHLAESKPAQPHRSQYQPTCPGQSQEDPCEDTSSLLFMCLQNSCSRCQKCLALAQQAQQ